MHQASRRRRTTETLQTDDYDPKTKTNNNKQTLYIIIGVVALIFGLLMLYKLFSSSKPGSISNTDKVMNNERIFDRRPPERNGMMDDRGRRDRDRDRDRDRGHRPDMRHREEMMRRSHEMPPFGDRGDPGDRGRPFPHPEMSGKLERDAFDREHRMRRDKMKRPPMRGDGKGPPFGGPDGRPYGGPDGAPPFRGRPPFGGPEGGPPNPDDPDYQQKMAKYEKYKKMMKAKGGPYNEMGEGPIFNRLNDERGNPRLRPEDVHAARDKLRNQMKGQLPGMGDEDGMENAIRDRREEV